MNTPLAFSEFYPQTQFHPDGGVFTQLRDPYAVNALAGDSYFDLGGFAGDQRIGPIVYPQGNYPLNRTDIFPALTPNFVLSHTIYTQNIMDYFESIGLYPTQIVPESVTTGVQIEQRFHSGYFDRIAPEGTSTTMTSSVRARMWKNAPYGKTILFNADTLRTEAGMEFYGKQVAQILRAYVGTKIESNKVEIDKITNPLFNGFMGMDLTYWTNNRNGEKKTIYDTISESIETWGLLQRNRENPAGLLREYAATQFAIRGTNIPKPVLLAPAGLVSIINTTNPKEQVVSETGRLALTNREAVGHDIGGPGYNQRQNVPSSIQVTDWGNFRVAFAPIDQGYSRTSASSFLTNRTQFGSVVFTSDDYNRPGSTYTSESRDVGIMCLEKDTFRTFTLSEMVKDNPIFDVNNNDQTTPNPRDSDFIRKFSSDLFTFKDTSRQNADYPFHRIHKNDSSQTVSALPIHTIGMSLSESETKVVHPQYVQFAGGALENQLALTSPSNNFITSTIALQIINEFKQLSVVKTITSIADDRTAIITAWEKELNDSFSKSAKIDEDDVTTYGSRVVDSFGHIWNLFRSHVTYMTGSTELINKLYERLYPMTAAIYKIIQKVDKLDAFEAWFTTHLSTIKKLTYDKYLPNSDVTEMDMFSFFFMHAGSSFVDSGSTECCSVQELTINTRTTKIIIYGLVYDMNDKPAMQTKVDPLAITYKRLKEFSKEGLAPDALDKKVTTSQHNLMSLDYYTSYDGLYQSTQADSITNTKYLKKYFIGADTEKLTSFKHFINTGSEFANFSTRYKNSSSAASLKIWCQLAVLRLLVTRSCVHTMIENNIPIPFALAAVRPHGTATTLSVIVAESGPSTSMTMLSDVRVQHHINPNRSGASEFQMSMASITVRPENILKIPNVVIREIHPEGNGDRIYTSKNLPQQNNRMDIGHYTRNINGNMDPAYQPGKNLPADIFILMLPTICDRTSLVDFFDLSGSFDYFNGNFVLTSDDIVKHKVGFQIPGVTTHYPGSDYYNTLWKFRSSNRGHYDPYGIPYNYDGITDHQINMPFQPNPYNTVVHLESYMEKSYNSFAYKPGKGVFGTFLQVGLKNLINSSCAWEPSSTYHTKRY